MIRVVKVSMPSPLPLEIELCWIEMISYMASASMLRDTLIEKVSDIEREQQTLDLRKRILETSIRRADALSTWEDSLGQEGPIWKMKKRSKEYYIKSAIGFIEGTEAEFMKAVTNHILYCAQHGGGESIQAANSIEQHSFEQGDYIAGFNILTRLPKPNTCDRLHVKPAGSYLCWLNITTAADSHESAEASALYNECDAIRAFLHEQNWELAGDVYETELSLYSGNKQEANYSEIEMRVVSKKGVAKGCNISI